jgi:hypothetical protein
MTHHNQRKELTTWFLNHAEARRDIRCRAATVVLVSGGDYSFEGHIAILSLH